jgi:hypothetical protein
MQHRGIAANAQAGERFDVGGELDGQ